eukprot:595652-Amorphochlora_amoeboformis.AAC.1
MSFGKLQIRLRPDRVVIISKHLVHSRKKSLDYSRFSLEFEGNYSHGRASEMGCGASAKPEGPREGEEDAWQIYLISGETIG